MTPTARSFETPNLVPTHQCLDHRILHQVFAVATRQRGGDGDQARVLAQVQILEARGDDCEFDWFGHVCAVR